MIAICFAQTDFPIPVSDETILDALKIPDVTDSADRLIELALRGGGPDNVTVVVADVVDTDYGPTQPIIAGAVSGDSDGHDQLTRPNTSAGRASAITPRKEVTKRVVPQIDTAPPPQSRRRMLIGLALTILLVLAALAVGRTVIRSYYYVTAYSGAVSIMQGIQISILGVPLHQPYSQGCLDSLQPVVGGPLRPGRREPWLPVDEAVRSGRVGPRPSRGRPAGGHAWTRRTRNCGGWPPSRCCRSARSRAPSLRPLRRRRPQRPGSQVPPAGRPSAPQESRQPPRQHLAPRPSPHYPRRRPSREPTAGLRNDHAAAAAGHRHPAVAKPAQRRTDAAVFRHGDHLRRRSRLSQANQERGIGWQLLTYAAGSGRVRRRAPGRQTLWRPYADPLLLPIAALLNGLGLVIIHRLDLDERLAEGSGRAVTSPQILWTLVGVGAFAFVVISSEGPSAARSLRGPMRADRTRLPRHSGAAAEFAVRAERRQDLDRLPGVYPAADFSKILSLIFFAAGWGPSAAVTSAGKHPLGRPPP